MITYTDDITDVVKTIAPELFPRFRYVSACRQRVSGDVHSVIVWGRLPSGANSEEEATVEIPADSDETGYAKAVLEGIVKLVKMVGMSTTLVSST